VSHLRPMRGEIGNTLIECPVVPCDQAFLDVQKFIDHCEKVHRPEFERHQNLNSAGFPDPASMGGVISQGGVASVREVQPDRPTRGPANDKPDCCSGFVTQEGRDIHQAIEHEPRRTYPPCGQPVAAGGPCLRDAGHYGVCSAAPDSAQQEPR